MHFAPPSSLPRAAVGYPPASFFALSPRLIDRSRRKTLHTLQAYRPIGRYRRSKQEINNIFKTCGRYGDALFSYTL